MDLTALDVAITNRAQDQCEEYVPEIDVDLLLHLRQVCKNGTLGPMEFEASGTYDGYPWHELYLNGTQVFTHDPCVTGEGPLSLFPPAEHTFEAKDNGVPTPLANWQKLPAR